MASGRGSNALALLEENQKLSHIDVALIITDKPQAGVIEIAKLFSKDCIIIEKKDATKEQHEREIQKVLDQYEIDWIFLAGYMRILSKDFIQNFYDANIQQSRIINIHPSLLPHYRGLNAYERAYNDHSPFTGISVHFVDAGMDTGKILVQEMFEASKIQSLEEFKDMGLKLEHKVYPIVLRNLAKIQKEGHL